MWVFYLRLQVIEPNSPHFFVRMKRLLTAVPLVCATQPSVAALPHVQYKISVLLFRVDTSAWTLESASKRGFERLLNHLLTKEWPEFDQECRQKRLQQAVRNAVENKYDVSVLEWWLTLYMPGQQSVRMIDVMALAVKYAQIPVLEWLHQELQGELPHLNEMIECNDPETVIWLYTHGRRHYNIHLCLPAHVWATANFQMVKQCLIYQEEDLSFRFIETSRAISVAIERGDLESVQWLFERRLSFQRYHLNQALSFGNLDVARWLLQRAPSRYFWYVYKTFTNPSHTNQVQISMDLVQWVVCEFDWEHDSSRLCWIKHAMRFAAKKGELDIVCYLFERFETGQDEVDASTIFSKILMDVAATDGHLAVLEWLHERSSLGCTTNAMDGAAANGYLFVVEWMHQNRSEGCTSNAMDAAAAANHLEIVQWLHHNRSEGCTHKAIDVAATHGHLNMVQWLHKNRLEGCTKKAMEGAARNGHLEMIRWLHENQKVGWTPKALNLAARHGRLGVVEWFHENRSGDFTSTTMDHAARNGHLPIIRFLHSNRKEGCSTDAMKKAAARGHFDTFKWLYENQTEQFSPVLNNVPLEANEYNEQALKCQALFTNHDRFGWFARKLILCCDFESVDLLVRKASSQGVVSVEHEFAVN